MPSSAEGDWAYEGLEYLVIGATCAMGHRAGMAWAIKGTTIPASLAHGSSLQSDIMSRS